jgi:ADP-ribosylglycohydrolase
MSRDKYRGALLGLAIGDALGTTVEFKGPGTFRPITDIVGGGPFNLKPGEWTDDTSMALCLAESLVRSVALTPKIRWIVIADGMKRAISAAMGGVSISATPCEMIVAASLAREIMKTGGVL